MEVALPIWLQLNSALTYPYHITKLHVFETLSLLAQCRLAQFTSLIEAQYLVFLLNQPNSFLARLTVLLERCKVFLDQGCQLGFCELWVASGQ